MITKRSILLKLFLIISVFGTVRSNYLNKTETVIKLTDLELNINQKLNRYVSYILGNLLTYVDSKTDAISQKIPNLEEKITQTLEESNKIIEENVLEKITQILDASNKKILEVEEKITQTLNANKKMEQNLTEINKKLLEKTRIMSAQMPCKEVAIVHNGKTRNYSIDDETFNHVRLKRNSSGHLIYFEMHFAIETDGYVTILLSQSKNHSDHYKLAVGCDSNQYTKLYTSKRKVEHPIGLHTPNILSPARFSDFFIIIDDDNLEFGKEGEASSLLAFYDSSFSLVNSFQFQLQEGKSAKIRYDCPASFGGFPYKKLSAVENQESLYFSVDSEQFNHVTIMRNDTGHLANFEIHFAIKTVGFGQIKLVSDNENSWEATRIELTVGKDGTTKFKHHEWQPLEEIDTPNIISSSQFRAFYVKIDNGNLKFGQEGVISPLISYDDTRLGLLDYIQFNIYSGPGEIRFDCPTTPVEGYSCTTP